MEKSASFQPLVTVYMPTYNRAKLLERAVESVLNQDYKNIELIVVDDYSTDSTHQYLARVAAIDSRFRYFINEKNSGACVSRNKAIHAANGSFITGLDDDDFILPNHITTFLECWNSIVDKACIALYSNVYIKGKNGKLKKFKKPNSCVYRDLIVGNWVGNQIFTKTETLKSIGGFDESLPAWQDLECWLRLLKTANSKAFLCNNYSYIVDMSHPHERITTKKASIINEAYNYISTKHNLSNYEKRLLKLQLTPYLNNNLTFKESFEAMIYLPKFCNIRHYFRAYLSSKIKRFKILKK